ncbi:efflux RND transporter permease subunit [Kerstersia gyiorum]|uniref:efflux RND transporter permease subunit n=1 Tax=Kerstersia gyiorum TaxID=206506 RepID=UPI00242E5A4C|nr:efflux RND transporter permease subunit [Kerstersia gyiorum]MCH4270240.1 efflux RND transporter permease subunit [Kerstersia gyiorum]MCI1228258.1 efflux RND transporter permease subunit [Kerstersia gyiorum]
MNLARPFVQRPIASILIALAILLLGLLAGRLMPVAPLPAVDFPAIMVRASLPGADPESMAATVAAPLERAFGSISGVSRMTSRSEQGGTNILLQFDLSRNINDAARDVQAAINTAQGELPAGMPQLPSYFKINPSQAPILVLALSSPNLSPGQLYDVAATVLAQKIAQIQGVSEVSVDGAALPAIRVQLNPQALAHSGISLDEVRQALADANPLQPRGIIENDKLRWQVQSADQQKKAAEYQDLVIRYQDGAAVRLADIATVTDSVEDRYTSGFHNHNPAVILMVSRQPGANIVATIADIRAQLPALQALIPADATLTVVADRSPGIHATLREAGLTLLIASALVVVVILGFLGSWRAALIPSLAIPISLVGALAIIYLYGFSLNNLSVMALIVAAGLVVDDAIVVMENIQRHIERGMAPLPAAIRGAGEMGFTLLAMNLALIMVFVAILAMGGMIERFFREFSITLAAAVLVSLFLSLSLTPSLCARLLPGQPAPGNRPRQAAWHERMFAVVRRGYGASLRWSLRRQPLALLALAGAMALTVFLFAAAPKGFLPQQDTGQLQGFIRGDDGASFNVMQPKIEQYRQLLVNDPAISDVIGVSGGGTGVSNGHLLVRLKPLGERTETANDIVNRLRTQQPVIPSGMLFLAVDQDINLPRSMGSSGDYELTLLSGDLELLRAWAPKVRTALMDTPELVDISPSNSDRTQQINLEIDREAARQLGVDMSTITSTLSNAFSQRQVATLYSPLNQYRIVMELDPRYTGRPETLEQLHVLARDGQRVPLSAFSFYGYSMERDRVAHDGPFAAENISFSVAEGVSLDAAMAAIDRTLGEIMLPNGVHARIGGNAGIFQSSMDTQPMLLLGVLVAVYLVLGILYESALHPLTILSTLPSAGLGAFLALRATHTEFTLIALLGLFLLIGMVMKNAILMVDFALVAQRRGVAAAPAIYTAACQRLRPILMTNMAGLLGALPLALGSGDGAEMRQPLGIAIVGGLAISQLVTLYTTPAIYLLMDRCKRRRSRRNEHAAADVPRR